MKKSEPGRIGLPRDLRVLKESGAASAGELREFIQQLRGRRPQEVLGLVAQSGLAQACFVSSLGTLVLLAILTAGPYAWGKMFPRPVKAPAAAAAAAPAPTQPQPAAQGGSAATGAETAPAGDNTPPPGTEKAMQEMGIGETKITDPRSNPLEDKGDDLLKDLN